MTIEKLDRVLRNLAIWTLVCIVSAAPSFVIAAMQANSASAIAGMLAGVAAFIVGYTALASSDWAIRLRQRAFVERTIYIGYGIRVGQSLLSFTGVVAIPDVICGIISGSVMAEISGQRAPSPDGGFGFFLAWTLLQGLLLNVVLGVLLVIIWAIQLSFITRPPAVDPTKVCVGCGYDLRASTAKCPECGTPIVPRSPETAKLAEVGLY